MRSLGKICVLLISIGYRILFNYRTLESSISLRVWEDEELGILVKSIDDIFNNIDNNMNSGGYLLSIFCVSDVGLRIRSRFYLLFRRDFEVSIMNVFIF